MTFDAATALVVVDMQNDFVDPAGTLSVAGAVGIIPFVNEHIRAAHEAGATVAYTQDWHPASTPHFAKDGGIWPVHCVGESWGAELHPDLLVIEDAAAVRKGTEGADGYSGFSVRDPRSPEDIQPTPLAGILEDHGIERVVVVGVATDYCVKETALDAIRLGFETLVLTDGVRSVDLEPGDGESAMAEMREAGVTLR